ncbi:MAG TPA: MopE-related protein [Myxococcota bacterium]|nr:MopE-related protein [Myxococcota bacterium]HRY94271.1 MopE-related protein [Myxococcota bacterium]
MKGPGILALVALAAWASGCSDDEHYTGWCDEQADCPECLSCVYNICIADLERCEDRFDNDCDGQTDEGCPDPCAGIVCDHPPARVCLDADQLRYHALPGSCTFGECAYMPLVVDCPAGCRGGACIGDACLGLTCVEDGNPCTDDGCDPLSGCTHTPNTAPCEDGDLCTGQDVCRGGVCAVGGGRGCDDGLACTSERCDPALGCVITPDDLACEDLDPCTDDRCDASAGCVFPLNAAACDDGDPCTMEDTCALGACVGVPSDLDHDGFIADGCGGDDCNDHEEWLNPDAEEVCDGYDNDCDGLTDLLGEDLCHYEAVCHRGVMTGCPAGPGPTAVPTVLEEDALWCASGSPFLLEANTVVTDGTRLTVGPCLEARMGDGITLYVRGDLVVHAERTSPAVFLSSSPNPTRSSWLGLSLEASGDYYHVLRGLKVMHAETGLGLHLAREGTIEVNHSVFESNQHGMDGAADSIYRSEDLSFIDNTVGLGVRLTILSGFEFSGNDIGIEECQGIQVENGVFRGNSIAVRTIGGKAENCLFEYNEHAVSTLNYYQLTMDLQGCTVVHNGAGITVGTLGVHYIKDGVLCDNGVYDIQNGSINDIDATNNWWCTTDPGEISTRIHDVYDDVALGRVIFEPFLTEEP